MRRRGGATHSSIGPDGDTLVLNGPPHRHRRPVYAAALSLLALALSAPAAAAETKTFTQQVPISVAGYEVKQSFALAPKPPEDGHITAMEVDIVDADGTPVPIQRLMLHHIVFVNLNRDDPTCNGTTFTGWDSRPSFGSGLPERFYAAGEERARLALPPGYGYRLSSDDNWAMIYMVMNHRAETDRAFIQYRFTYETGASDADTTDVKPYWLDVRNCQADPIYNVPGTGGPGSTHLKEYDYTMPQGGRIVAGGRARSRRRQEPDPEPARLRRPGARPVAADLGPRQPPLLQRAADPARAGPDQHERLRHLPGDSRRRGRASQASTPITTTRIPTQG